MSNNSATDAVTRCMICGATGTEEVPIRRGICANHYMQFRRAMQSLPLEKQDEFEQAMIDQGKILPPQKGGRSTNNPFAEAAQQFMPEKDKQFLEQVAKTKEQFNKPKPRKGKKQ